MGKKIRLTEVQLKKLIAESIKKCLVNEVEDETYKKSKKVMPWKYMEIFKNRVLNASHGSHGEIKRTIVEFFKDFKDKIPNEAFTIENLMDLADKLQYGSHDHIIPGAKEGWNGFFAQDELGGDNDAFGPGRFNESKTSVKLNESQLKQVIAESVKKVLKEGLPSLPGYDRWKTSIPKEWDKSDMISEEDFYDMIRSADDEQTRDFIEWLKETPEEYRVIMQQLEAGNENNVFFAAIDNGISWKEIASEVFDLKPVKYYPGDMD